MKHDFQLFRLTAAERVYCKIFKALPNNKKIVVGLHHSTNDTTAVVVKRLLHLLRGRAARLHFPHTVRVPLTCNFPVSPPTGRPPLAHVGPQHPPRFSPTRSGVVPRGRASTGTRHQLHGKAEVVGGWGTRRLQGRGEQPRRAGSGQTREQSWVAVRLEVLRRGCGGDRP